MHVHVGAGGRGRRKGKGGARAEALIPAGCRAAHQSRAHQCLQPGCKVQMLTVSGRLAAGRGHALRINGRVKGAQRWVGGIVAKKAGEGNPSEEEGGRMQCCSVLQTDVACNGTGPDAMHVCKRSR